MHNGQPSQRNRKTIPVAGWSFTGNSLGYGDRRATPLPITPSISNSSLAKVQFLFVIASLVNRKAGNSRFVVKMTKNHFIDVKKMIIAGKVPFCHLIKTCVVVVK